jgi:hypothetical protein
LRLGCGHSGRWVERNRAGRSIWPKGDVSSVNSPASGALAAYVFNRTNYHIGSQTNSGILKTRPQLRDELRLREQFLVEWTSNGTKLLSERTATWALRQMTTGESLRAHDLQPHEKATCADPRRTKARECATTPSVSGGHSGWAPERPQCPKWRDASFRGLRRSAG